MSNRSGRVVLAAVLAASCGAAGSFVLTTAVMDSLADSVLIGLTCAAALVCVLAFQGATGLSELRETARGSLALAAAGGALAFWAAPLLALSQRASDAPSGSDSLFFTTSAWGLACIALAFALRAERPPVTALAGALAAVAGAAGLLASWEYPSSFSPFAKFPIREALMLVAGVLFAAGAVALAEAGRRAGPRVAVAAGLGGATALGLVGAVVQLPDSSQIGQGVLYPCIYLGIALAVFALGWTYASASVGVSRTATSLLGVPVLVMALAGIERVTAIYGPNPIAWSGALAGAAVIASGTVVVWLAERPIETERSLRRPPFLVPFGLALAALVLGLASLATPALDALAEGGTGVPFRATWIMVGAESAAGWLTVAAAGLALAAVMVARSGGSTKSWAPACIAVAVCAAAAVPLIGTTLHTWNRWVPAEVQQTYGTEYSRIVVEPHIDYVRVIAMVLATAAAAALALSMRRNAARVTLKEDS